MLNIQKLRTTKHKILALGLYPGIIQSMLDYDYLTGKSKPDLKAIVATGKNYHRAFWGDQDILIPVYPNVDSMPSKLRESISLFINLTSGRRTRSSTLEAFESCPNLFGGAVFAENVPEKHAIEIYSKIKKINKFVIGPATVGLLIPGSLKLGPIGGIQAEQLTTAQLFEPGNVAVFSSSGGMTNELINIVTRLGKRISFSLSFGGDRFPTVTPIEAFIAAEKDKETEYIIYFGELGGYDEYELASAIAAKKITKKIIAYIGGTISEMFEMPPQFGHAKAMASRGDETAKSKTKALAKVGVSATNSFNDFIKHIGKIESVKLQIENGQLRMENKISEIQKRTPSLFMNSVSRDVGGSVEIIGEEMLSFATTKTYGHIVGSMILGRQLKSKVTAEFIELILKLLVDHGPYVSGAVSTMIAARAGKDLVSSLASGLLTIGPRFGGAINQAAGHWLEGVGQNISPSEYVEEVAKSGKRISGIGHKKYRIDSPDPRVFEILKFISNIKKTPYTDFAKDIEKITTSKKGNLILNVDGAIGAVLLDLLTEKEEMEVADLQKLVDIEFFNALFVIARAVGFTAHYLDQRRLDEGLFRLSSKEVGFFNEN